VRARSAEPHQAPLSGAVGFGFALTAPLHKRPRRWTAKPRAGGPDRA